MIKLNTDSDRQQEIGAKISLMRSMHQEVQNIVSSIFKRVAAVQATCPQNDMILEEQRILSALEAIKGMLERLRLGLVTEFEKVCWSVGDAAAFTNADHEAFGVYGPEEAEEWRKKREERIEAWRRETMDFDKALAVFSHKAELAQITLQSAAETVEKHAAVLVKIDPVRHSGPAKTKDLAAVGFQSYVENAADALQVETDLLMKVADGLNEQEAADAAALKGMWEDLERAAIDALAAQNPAAADAAETAFDDVETGAPKKAPALKKPTHMTRCVQALTYLFGEDHPAKDRILSRIERLQAEGRPVGASDRKAAQTYATGKIGQLAETCIDLEEAAGRMRALREEETAQGLRRPDGLRKKRGFITLEQVQASTPAKYRYDAVGQTFFLFGSHQVTFKGGKPVPVEQAA